MKNDETLIWERYSTIVEDIQSVKSQALKILKNNGITNDEEIVNDIANAVESEAMNIEPDKRRWVSDAHIPALALLYVGQGATNLDLVLNEYSNYLKISKFADANELGKRFQQTASEVKSKQLFKKPEEKQRVFRDFFSKFTSDVHANMKVETPSGKIADNYDPQDVVYKDENIVVLLADTRNKCINYGTPNLCISWRGPNNYYWRYRMGKQSDVGMTTYFVYEHDKVGKEGFIVDALGTEDGPINDGTYGYTTVPENAESRKTEDQIIKRHPLVKPAFENDVFKFIPYTDNEQKFHDIDEHVDSITDNRIKEYEDYVMFIETGKPVKPGEWRSIPKSIIKDMVVKYASVGENFNIPDEFKNKYLTPSSIRNYNNKHLKAVKEWIITF